MASLQVESSAKPKPVVAPLGEALIAKGCYGTRTSHTWITDSGRALSVRVDEPVSGLAQGAVVIVPSFARESVVSFRAVRALAIRAAEAGFVALSFSLSGDGDSEPLAHGDDLSSAWVADVQAVLTRGHALAPNGPVHVVGLRLGACLVHALSAVEGEFRLLWEPVSGSAFIRQHRALRRFAVEQEVVPDGMELYGAHLTNSQAASLKTLVVPTGRARSDAAGTSLRVESDRLVAQRIANVSPHFAEIPAKAIEEIVASFSKCAPMPITPWVPDRSAVIAMPGGGRVVETHVEVGPHRLHGVLTRDPEVAAGPGIIYTAMGVELACGPGNLFAVAARSLAARGVVSLRADRRQLGEDVDVDRTSEPRPYLESAVEDVADAVRFLAEQTTGQITGVGVCAGAWCLLLASSACRLDAVVAINAVHWHPNESAYDEVFYAATYGEESHVMGRFAGQDFARPSSGRRARAAASLSHAKHAVLAHANYQFAMRLPSVRAWVCHEEPPEKVGAFLERVDRSVAIRLLLGTWENDVFTSKSGRRALRARRVRGVRSVLQVDPRLDHSLMSELARRAVFEAIEGEATGEPPSADRRSANPGGRVNPFGRAASRRLSLLTVLALTYRRVHQRDA